MDSEVWLQMGLLFWAAVALFARGARERGLPLRGRTLRDVIGTAAAVVVLFALISEGRGCRSYSSTDQLGISDVRQTQEGQTSPASGQAQAQAH